MTDLSRTCERCERKLPHAARFCRHCGGKALQRPAEDSLLRSTADTRCPGCDAQVAPHARFCRTCGAVLTGGSESVTAVHSSNAETSRTTRRAVTSASAPRPPVDQTPDHPDRQRRWPVIAVFCFLAVGAGIGAYLVVTDGSSDPEVVSTQPMESAPSSRPPGEPPDAPSASDLRTWPKGVEAYTIIVASKESRTEAEAVARDAADGGAPAGILRSDRYTTLRPGFWVAFIDEFDSAQAAKADLDKYRSRRFSDAFVDLISKERQEPGGTITATSVGAVTVGMSRDDVERYFTPPDRRGAVDWTWTFPDGELTLQFETATGTLNGYDANTAELATVSGAVVGGPFEPVERRYGSQLTQSPIGEHTLTLSEGKPGTYPALTFSVIDTRIASIGGGYPRPAGE